MRERCCVVDNMLDYQSRGVVVGAKMLGKLSVQGRPTIWLKVGQGPIALAVGAGGGCLDFFCCLSFPLFFLPLWEMTRYRLKYCLKRPLYPKQPTNNQFRNCVRPIPCFSGLSDETLNQGPISI